MLNFRDSHTPIDKGLYTHYKDSNYGLDDHTPHKDFRHLHMWRWPEGTPQTMLPKFVISSWDLAVLPATVTTSMALHLSLILILGGG